VAPPLAAAALYVFVRELADHSEKSSSAPHL